MSSVYKRGPARIQSNLTPMIDVTFLLIVFFVVVSQLVDVEHVDMELPRPDHPVTVAQDESNRLVINVVPGPEGEAIGYRIGMRQFGTTPGELARLTDRLVEHHRASPDGPINLRADRETHYRWIDPVLGAISEAARRVGDPDLVARVNLVVVRED